jgi:hypothetical protein
MHAVQLRHPQRKGQTMVDGRGWTALARATTRFIAEAKYYHFCEDILALIERRLYKESPYPIHHRKKEDKNESIH